MCYRGGSKSVEICSEGIDGTVIDNGIPFGFIDISASMWACVAKC